MAGKGRGLVATQPCEAGELITVEESMCTVLYIVKVTILFLKSKKFLSVVERTSNLLDFSHISSYLNKIFRCSTRFLCPSIKNKQLYFNFLLFLVFIRYLCAYKFNFSHISHIFQCFDNDIWMLSSLFYFQMRTNCWNCCGELVTWFPCPGCPAIFCSKACMEVGHSRQDGFLRLQGVHQHRFLPNTAFKTGHGE